MRVVIFANGELPNLKRMGLLLRPDDFIIAADGGLQHLRALEKWPNLLIGDMDSVSPADMEWLDGHPLETRKFPTEKDFTDLELALQAALERGADAILLAAALGGRLDQSLANIALLQLPELADLDVCMDDGHTEVRLIENRLDIQGRAGDTVSLIPLGSEVQGVRTHELRYPLRSETLTLGETRGISNVMLADSAAVEISRGKLLCVHIRQENT